MADQQPEKQGIVRNRGEEQPADKALAQQDSGIKPGADDKTNKAPGKTTPAADGHS